MGLVGSSSHTTNTKPRIHQPFPTHSHTYHVLVIAFCCLNTHHRHAIQVSTHTYQPPYKRELLGEKNSMPARLQTFETTHKRTHKGTTTATSRNQTCQKLQPSRIIYIKNRSPHRSITSIKQVLVKYQVTSNFHQASNCRNTLISYFTKPNIQLSPTPGC